MAQLPLFRWFNRKLQNNTTMDDGKQSPNQKQGGN